MQVNKRLYFLFFFLIPAFCYADAGLPMIIYAYPFMILGLIPIILIESISMKNMLQIDLKKSIIICSSSNIFSTLLGVPLAWMLLVFLQIITGGDGNIITGTFLDKVIEVTWQAPWLLPDEENFHWMVPCAMLFLLIPFFFVSWWSEYQISKILIKYIDRKKIRTAVLYSNIYSYIFLGMVIILLWIIGIFK